ncbi:MAG: HRDC domain-containing protein [Chloroflexi bacterium]|nr:HRDC domain-containing protein [Chloroflexota bacterium]
MMAHLRDQPLIAVDTESDSLYRYHPRVCLIQISVCVNGAGERTTPADPMPTVDYLLDPLSFHHLQPLGEILADPVVEVLFHAAENDIRLLDRDFNFRCANVYDTQLAARILGRNGVGLAAILQDEFGVVSDKSMQRTDWGRRPLTPQQMTYAQLDTHYLPVLRQRQMAALQEADRWEEAQEGFAALAELRYEEPAQERTFWRLKQTREVAQEDLGLLEELWSWREITAERLDRPPFKVLGDTVLGELTQRKPTSLAELVAIRGFGDHQASRFGREVLEAVRHGQRRPAPPFPESTVRPEQLLSSAERARYDVLRQWRTETATARGVDPDIVFNNDTLLQIATQQPSSLAELQQIAAIGPWKARTYGPAVLALVNR